MAELDAMRLARGSAYVVAQSVVVQIVAAVALAFVARILTQAEMGIVVALNLIVGVAQVLSDLGFGGALTKFVAEYRGKGADYTPISFGAVSVKLLTAGSAAVVCIGGAPLLSGYLLESVEFAYLFQLLSVSLLTSCLTLTVNRLLLGVNRIKEMVILNVVSSIVGKGSAVALLMCGFGLAGFVSGWILGGLAYVALGALIIARNRYVKVHPVGEVMPYLKMLVKFSWPLFVTNVVAFLYSWFDRAILLAYVPLSEVAVYNIALQAFGVLFIIPVALRTILFPYYSEQYGKDENKKIVAGVYGSSRYVALLYTPFALGLMATANPGITLFAGSAYAGGDTVLATLCLFGGLTALSACFGGLLLVLNMTPKVLLINLASVVGSIVMSPFLLPSFGVVGMALVRGVAMIISLTLTVVAVRKRLPIRFDREALWKSWCASIIMFLVVWLIQRINFSPYLLPLYIVVGGAVYVIALRALRTLNKNDIWLVRHLLGRRATLIADIVEKILI